MIKWVSGPGFEPYQWRLTELATPFGPLWAVYAGHALVMAELDAQLPWPGGHWPRTPTPPWLYSLFESAWRGTPEPIWAQVDPGFTLLERALLSQASDIPFGTTMSYGMLAEWAGFPGRARAAGRAMSRSPSVYVIPTHRVIRADGQPALRQRDALSTRLREYEGIVLAKAGALEPADRCPSSRQC